MDTFRELDINSENTAVIVIDKQYGYLQRQENDGGVVQLENVLPKIDDFIKKMRQLGVSIIWTKMVENKKESPKNIHNKLTLDPLAKDRIHTQEKSFEIIGEQPLANELIVDKLYYDAFARTDLNDQLTKNNVKTIILVGGYTSRCILGTAYGANGHDYNILVCNDLVANPDNFVDEAKSALRIIDSILGYVTTSKNILDYLKKSA